jgi:8-oxo-dGTP diphosphatase
MLENRIHSERTLCFPIRDDAIILGLKLARHGKGNYNGFGGHVEPNESIGYATVRELKEESGLIAYESDLVKRAVIEFYFPSEPENNQRVHIYFLNTWSGIPEKTDEMDPKEFSLSDIPYDKMWDSDRIWLKHLMDTGKNIKAEFHWKKDTLNGKYIVDTYNIVDVDGFE